MDVNDVFIYSNEMESPISDLKDNKVIAMKSSTFLWNVGPWWRVWMRQFLGNSWYWSIYYYYLFT